MHAHKHAHSHTPHAILICSKCTLVNVLIRHQLLRIEMGKRSYFSSPALAHTRMDKSLYIILPYTSLSFSLSLSPTVTHSLALIWPHKSSTRHSHLRTYPSSFSSPFSFSLFLSLHPTSVSLAALCVRVCVRSVSTAWARREFSQSASHIASPVCFMVWVCVCLQGLSRFLLCALVCLFA